MTIESWQPDSEKKIINAEELQLKEFIAMGDISDVEENTANLHPQHIEKLLPLMKQSREFWFTVASELSEQEIHQLIRFFTLAEENNSSLFAGNDSPVIALNKALKKNGPATA